MNMILYVRKPRNIERIPKNLPMLMISGLDDPVGEYGKGVYRAYNSYHGHIDDIDLRLYEDCRHELCNELNKEEIYEEIYGWIMNHMSKQINNSGMAVLNHSAYFFIDYNLIVVYLGMHAIPNA